MATAPDGSAVLQPVGDGSPPAGGTAGVEAAALSMRLVAAAEAAAEAAKAATALASRSSAETIDPGGSCSRSRRCSTTIHEKLK